MARRKGEPVSPSGNGRQHENPVPGLQPQNPEALKNTHLVFGFRFLLFS